MFYFLDLWTDKCVKQQLTEDFAKECTPSKKFIKPYNLLLQANGFLSFLSFTER